MSFNEKTCPTSEENYENAVNCYSIVFALSVFDSYCNLVMSLLFICADWSAMSIVWALSLFAQLSCSSCNFRCACWSVPSPFWTETVCKFDFSVMGRRRRRELGAEYLSIKL
eukprot:5778204-Amphidinium_carterae.1